MTVEELRTFYHMLAGFGVGAVCAALIFVLLVRFFLTSYLTEKAKNLATKEDIAEITKIVEDERAPFVESVERLKSKHQLRMAAVDRRLQAHQEAFTHWRELIGSVYTDGISAAVIKCQSWWEQNCVYLEPKVREAFMDAYSSASYHHQLVQSRPEVEVVKQSWNRIVRFPDVLFAAVELPTLTQVEVDALKLPTSEKPEA